MISLLPASNIEIDEDPSATGRPLKSPFEVPSGMPSFEPGAGPAVRSAFVAEHSRSKAGKAAASTLDEQYQGVRTGHLRADGGR